ncbi:MAG: hypothetical protein JO126_02880 [Alphaproteobacteria bacterium]|nr:hypothetical protein [Alphaproteobacteria bacterium]MBV8548385.1 hypothetical protein [Alphaproteobacteria bacterium]
MRGHRLTAVFLAVFCIAAMPVFAADKAAVTKDQPANAGRSATSSQTASTDNAVTGPFAEIAYAGNIWVVEAGDPTANYAACAAYSKAGPNALQSARDLATRMDFARTRQDTGTDDKVVLSVYAEYDPSIYDKAIMFDDVSVTANRRQMMRVVQRFKPEILKARLESATTVKFSLAGKTTQLPATLFLQLLDKLDQCATLKK